MSAINVVLAFMIIACFLISVVIHENAHALVASLLGDPTPRNEGRQSLGLRIHLDPLGTLLCVVLAFLPILAGPLGMGLKDNYRIAISEASDEPRGSDRGGEQTPAPSQQPVSTGQREVASEHN